MIVEVVRPRLERPFRISRGVQDVAELIQITVEHGGVRGHGEAAPQEDDGQTVDAALEALTDCGEVLGDDPFALDEIEERTQPWREATAAMAGLDAALHDLCGKLVGVPVWRLLGLPRVGAPTTLTVSLDVPAAMAQDAGRWLARFPDVRYLKLKLGAGDGRDVERVRAVRAVTALPFLVDANAAWSLDEAVETIDALSGLDVRFVEQPLAPRDPAGAELKARSALPVVVDEDCHDLSDVARCAEIAHGINIKLVKCGGIREAVRMVHAARALDMRVMMGCMVESSLGIAASASIAALVDVVDLDGNLLLAEDPWRGLQWTDGRQVPSERPGLGVVRA